MHVGIRRQPPIMPLKIGITEIARNIQIVGNTKCMELRLWCAIIAVLLYIRNLII